MQQDSITYKRMAVDNAIIIPEIISLLNEGHTVTMKLRGYSMRPFLEDGRDKALLKKADSIAAGDVVLAEIATKRYVLHRIKNIEADNITLLGDGNLSTESCRTCNIHGKAVCFYRKNSSKPDYTDGLKWKIYSYIWTHLLPIRRYLLFLYRGYLKCTNIFKKQKTESNTPIKH